ncbi:MAG: cupin domain-containing protein [Anaerolineales bacterium]|jgi:transcriptional regulator with XRE-family HTH domain
MPSSTEPQVGEKIKILRARRGFSLRELSDQCGLSFNAISKIERGENSPTVASLHKIASALEVHITDLFRQEIQQFAVFVKSEDSTLLKSDGIMIESLGSGLPNQQLEPFKMIVSPDSGNMSEPVSHSGEEFVYCLSGRIEYVVGDETFVLEPGDKLLFKANRPHCWRNLGKELAEVMLVIETDKGKPLPHKIH